MNTIETERLLLRPWKIDDAAEAASLFRYASDPEIGLRCGWPPHTSVEGSMHDIRNILAVENNWAITIKGGAPNSNAPVGSIALKPVSHRTADAVAADPELTKRYGKYLGVSMSNISFTLQTRSAFNVQTIVDSVIYRIDKKQVNELYTAIPKVKTVFEDLNAILLNKLLKRNIDLIKYSPE